VSLSPHALWTSPSLSAFSVVNLKLAKPAKLLTMLATMSVLVAAVVSPNAAGLFCGLLEPDLRSLNRTRADLLPFKSDEGTCSSRFSDVWLLIGSLPESNLLLSMLFSSSCVLSCT